MGKACKAMKRLIFAVLLSASLLYSDIDTNRILFLLHRGELAEALDLYHASSHQQHDHESLQRIGQIILDSGYRDSNPEIQLMALFGAGISANEKTLYIIEEAVKSPVPPMQLAALGLLARSQKEGFEEGLRYALRSPFLLLRLEALYHLAESKNPKTAAYTESLMAIVDEELYPIFPEIFAEAGDGASTKMLKRLISHAEENVRVATILAIAKRNRDDFLPKVRTLSTHQHPKQLEACAYAFGVFKDGGSEQKLRELTASSYENVRLAALLALYRLGRKDTKTAIEQMALAGNIFAIAALEEVTGSEETLASLLHSPIIHVRVNATVALLRKRDARSKEGLNEILLKDPRDYAFVKTYSPGRSAVAWKAVPSALQNSEEMPALTGPTQAFKNAVLAATLELDEKTFIQVAGTVLAHRQNELVPTLVALLENKQTPEAIAILKRYQQKAGAPLIRQYCNLALYRLKEQGPYEQLIKEWILSHMSEPLFHIKPESQADTKEHGSTFTLTPDETSKLLIESIESLARAQNTLSIDILLELIKNGHPKNKYALAGLLMRVAQ